MILAFFITLLLIFMGLLVILKGIHFYEKNKEINLVKAEIMYFFYAILGSILISTGAINWSNLVTNFK